MPDHVLMQAVAAANAAPVLQDKAAEQQVAWLLGGCRVGIAKGAAVSCFSEPKPTKQTPEAMEM